MYKNYFYLFRCAGELAAKIIGNNIEEIYTQEKDKLSITIQTKPGNFINVNISANAQSPFITLKEQHKAKKNTKNFFTDFLPDTILDVRIALGDRILKFILRNSSMYFIIRGSQTNICLIDKEFEIYFFKKIDEKRKGNIKSELLDTTFISRLEPIYNMIGESNKSDIVKNYKFIDKSILNEVAKRPGDWKSNLTGVINEIVNSEISVFIDEKLSNPLFIPSTFSGVTEKGNYQDYFSALNKYFSLLYSRNKDQILRNEIEKFIEKELAKLSDKINNLKGRIEAGSKEEKYYRIGNLLLAHLSFLRKGMCDVVLNDAVANVSELIELDEKLTPQQNIEKYFDKAKAEKINFIKSKELLSTAEREYKRLIQIREKIFELPISEILLIIKNYRIKMDSTKRGTDKERPFNFRHYLIDSKYHLYVGKDSKNNDLLTTKFAKQNDFWFHARSVSGSHAVLRIDNTKEPIPKNILKKAASITAYHSKSKTSKLASVSYTFKKYVVKKKDLNPGQVILLKENVLLVQPEIPVGCELLDD